MSFSASFLNGLQVGQAITSMKDKKARERIAADGMDAAKAERQGQIDNAITEVKTLPGPTGQGVLANPAMAGEQTPAAPGGMPAGPLQGLAPQAPELQGITDQPAKPTAKTTYKVKGDDREFDSRETAAQLAERQADNLTDLFYKNVGPQMEAHFLERGDVEKATAWKGFLDDRATKQGMREWARGMNLLNMGDTKAGFEALIKAQHTKGFGTDVEITGYEPIKDAKGKEVGGARVKYKTEDGVEGYRDFATLEDAAETAIALMAPERQFEIYEGRRKAAAEREGKKADRREKLEDEAWLAEYKGRIQRNNSIATLQTRAALGLGGGKDGGGGAGSSRNPSRQYKHPYDVRLELRQAAEKNSHAFRKMSAQQRRAYLDEIMRTELGYTDDEIRQAERGPRPAAGGDTMDDGDLPENLPLL